MQSLIILEVSMRKKNRANLKNAVAARGWSAFGPARQATARLGSAVATTLWICEMDHPRSGQLDAINGEVVPD